MATTDMAAADMHLSVNVGAEERKAEPLTVG